MNTLRIFLSTPFTLVLLALFIATCTMPMYIPDSYEQALGFLCRTQDHPSCTQISLDFRPPSMSIALAPFALGMSPFLVVGALSLLCAAWAIFPIAWTLKNHTKSATLMWCGVGTIILSPTIHRLTSLADARIFILPFLFASWALLWMKQPKKHHLFISGLCMGIGATTRPELVLGIILLSVFSILLHRKQSGWTLFGAWTPYVLWVSLLSIRAQKLVFGPRHWEDALLAIWDFVPQRMALRLYGMGMYSPQARDIPSNVSAHHTLDLLSGWDWLVHVASMTPVIFILGTLVIAAGLRTHRNLSLSAIAISLPYLVAAFLPQARAPLFPQANMIPVLIVLYCSVGFFAWIILVEQTRRTLWIRISMLICIAVCHANTVTFPESPTGIEYTPSGSQAQRYLHTSSPSTYMSSYENAALIWTAHQQWKQHNSPWERPTSSFTLRSNIDADIIPNEKPVAFWADGDSWVLLSYSEREIRD